MREGQNPAKMGLAAYKPKRLGLALLSCIPQQSGYFTNSLEVLRYQIASIHRNTTEFDLLVFDNGSCPEVQEELRLLQSRGFIHFLVLSRYNMGKTGALNWILASLPNELIGFSDGDVLFRPGWLEKSLEILQAFPTAGLVSAQPCLFDILKGAGVAYQRLEEDPRYQLSQSLADPAVVTEYGRGVGLEDLNIAALKQKPVSIVEENATGVRAIVGPSHMQFILPITVARSIIPLDNAYALYREETKKINAKIDQLGLLQLTTLEAFVYHMGNHLDETTLDEIGRMQLDAILQRSPAVESSLSATHSRPLEVGALRIFNRLGQVSFVNLFLRRLYNFLFMYFAQKR